MNAGSNGSGWPSHPVGRVALLKVDPDLAGPDPPAEVLAARDRLTAAVYRVPAGGTIPPRPVPAGAHAGFLLIKGVMLFEVSACGRTTAELVGPGDLVRLWQSDPPASLAREVKWSVLEQAVLADLGSLTSASFGGAPKLLETLLKRYADRAEAAAVQRSIAAHVRVDVRLLAYLWHLADRFGVVVPGAVRLEIPLTHAVLARLIGARRPTVTTALQRLAQLGYLRREGRAFVLVGDVSAVGELESRSPARGFALPDTDGHLSNV